MLGFSAADVGKALLANVQSEEIMMTAVFHGILLVIWTTSSRLWDGSLCYGYSL